MQSTGSSHPPDQRLGSSEPEEAVVDAHPRVFEYSPWIAKRALEHRFRPAQIGASGPPDAPCRAFRKADAGERLRVLRAPPDLAGNLGGARRLMTESPAEQADAGLDHLTDEEWTEFTSLNGACTKNFGFPFAIAVRDPDNAGILDAFRRRRRSRRASVRAYFSR